MNASLCKANFKLSNFSQCLDIPCLHAAIAQNSIYCFFIIIKIVIFCTVQTQTNLQKELSF